MAKKIITAIPVVSGVETQFPEITGDRQIDLQAYRKSTSIDFGIQLLKHYVPNNQRLIDYCQAVKDKNYISDNLNVILYEPNT